MNKPRLLWSLCAVLVLNLFAWLGGCDVSLFSDPSVFADSGPRGTTAGIQSVSQSRLVKRSQKSSNSSSPPTSPSTSSTTGTSPSSSTTTSSGTTTVGSSQTTQSSPTTTTATVQSPATAATLITDLAVYPEPPLPSLLQAGAQTIDPTFGTKILRLTDGADGNSGVQVQYAYWPVFNVDSTRIHVVGTYEATRSVFYKLDPNTTTASNQIVLRTPPPSGWLMERSDMIWSGSDPDVIYGHNEVHKLWAYNVATNSYSLIKDFSNQVLPNGGLYQMSKSLQDDVFAFSLTDSSGNPAGFLVWKRSTNQILLRQVVANINEVQVDKSGQFLSVVFNGNNNQVWTLATGRFENLTWGVDGFAHYDSGQGTLLTVGFSQKDLRYRQLATPHVYASLLPGYISYALQSDHFSMLADNERWGLISRYSLSGGPVRDPLDNEVFQIATDGSNRVRRIAHHRSVAVTYEAQPKANISRDGRFVAFTSNWGRAGGRLDVYVTTLPAAPFN